MDTSQFILQVEMTIVLFIVIFKLLKKKPSRFECSECGWKGYIIPDSKDPSLGTYCPGCSDQG